MTIEDKKYLESIKNRSKLYSYIFFISLGFLFLFIQIFKDFKWFAKYESILGIISISIILFLILFVTVNYIYSLFLYRKYIKESKGWPQVECKIVFLNNSFFDGISGGLNSPLILYKYYIDNREYYSTKISFDVNIGSYNVDKTKTLLAKYKYGSKRIKAYYNPINPSISVLERIEVFNLSFYQKLSVFTLCTGVVLFIYLLIKELVRAL